MVGGCYVWFVLIWWVLGLFGFQGGVGLVLIWRCAFNLVGFTWYAYCGFSGWLRRFCWFVGFVVIVIWLWLLLICFVVGWVMFVCWFWFISVPVCFSVVVFGVLLCVGSVALMF